MLISGLGLDFNSLDILDDEFERMVMAEAEKEILNGETHYNGFGQKSKPKQPDKPINVDLLRGTSWLNRKISPRDLLLGELLSTTSRMLFSGPTGRGKSMILLGWAFSIADGAGFLHWKGSGKPRNVIYFDGEMPRELAQRRMAEAAKRHGRIPPTFYYFNWEDFADDLKPLTKKEAQRFFDRII